MIIALSALDIDEASGGRFRLGLGAGVKRLNETWHGVEYGRPAPHLRETVEAVRLIIERRDSGEPIRYEGKYHDIDIKGWVRPHPKVRETIPIYTAAVQEGMARVAGDVADGMIGHPMCSMRWLDEVLVANFELGLRRSGRERSSFDFLPASAARSTTTRRPPTRRRGGRSASTRRSAPTPRCGRCTASATQAAAVGDAFRRGDFAAMPSTVPDEMVDTYCAAGPLDKVRERVEAVAERGDGVWLGPPTYFLAPEQIAAYQRADRRRLRARRRRGVTHGVRPPGRDQAAGWRSRSRTC